tara:strand:+ start:308 stop:1534 length:1227 start_codon:yes stop_codon:yes gene_type:complete
MSNKNLNIDGYLPTDAYLKKWARLKKSVKDGSYLTKGDEFHGQIEQIITYTRDYMHPELDKDCPDIIANAKYECMQVRQEAISDDPNGEKFNSIHNNGVTSPGMILKRFTIDKDKPHIKGDVYDSNSRCIIARAVEKKYPTRRKITLTQAFVTDKDLCDWLIKNAEFFQTGANDHDPAESMSENSLKSVIKERILRAPKVIRESEQFKARLKVVFKAMCTTRPHSTIDKWISAEYKSLEANNNGISTFNEQEHRQRTIRKAIQAAIPGFNSKAWHPNKKGVLSLKHKDYKVYGVPTAGGAVEKAFGTEDTRVGEGEDTRKSICVVYVSGATTADKITKAQNAFFKKNESTARTKTRGKNFDYTYVLGQEQHIDLGTLLTKSEVDKKYNKTKNDEESNKVINLKEVIRK